MHNSLTRPDVYFRFALFNRDALLAILKEHMKTAFVDDSSTTAPLSGESISKKPNHPSKISPP